MAKVSSSDVRPGDTVVYENILYEVINYEHVKPGKGGAFVRLKLRNIKLNTVLDKTLRPTDSMDQVELELKDMQYLYKEGEQYMFMDNVSYEQHGLDNKILGDAVNYLLENEVITVKYHGEEPLGVKLPASVVLKVVETPPAVRGNTVQSATKEAKLETGYTVQVPMFVEEGQKIKVDTRTGKYMERA
jgi:elongation factor P